MNKIKSTLIGACVLVTMLAGCLDEYQDLNTDTELLGQTDPRNVFTGATANFNNSTRDHLVSKYSGVMQYMQYIVFYEGAREGAYVNPTSTNRPSPYTPYYSDYYNKIGLQLRYLVNSVIPANAEPERFQDLAAIANILETYEAWLMFDVNGAAPYTEAFKAATENIRTPRYDLYQQDLNGTPLYEVFDGKVKDNIAVLQKSDDTQYKLGNNDYFYKGDIAKWIKFANTLRIKMAQRMEKANSTYYKTVVADALSNSGGIISSLDESCIYNHPNEHNNNTDDMHILTYQYCASRTLVNFMAAYSDPRLPLLVRRNGFGDGNNNTTNDENFETVQTYVPDYATRYAYFINHRFNGMAANPDSANSGWSRSSYYTIGYKDGGGVDRTITIRHNSQIESRYFVKNGGRVGTQITARDKEDSSFDVSQETISLFTPMITYPETCFMMAEIAFKEGQAMGGKDALAWFREGIKASMQQYQAWAVKMAVPAAMNQNSGIYAPITAAMIDTYLAQPEFQTVSLEKIITQQWVNLYMRPEEAWATWKRTGLPAFKNQPVPENGVAFLETIATGGDGLIVPRRAALGAPNTENINNYNDAVKQLTADPNYGTAVDRTEGRIWWDKP